jgi:hypothetical protein
MADEAWPHPERCPSADCRGQFFLLKHYGAICTVRLLQLTDGKLLKIFELSDKAHEEKTQGLGLA